MKHIITLCAFLSNTALLNAQAFRDPDNDMTDGSTVYRESAGQLLTTMGAELFHMAARSEGPKVSIYCGKSSDIHYVWRSVHGDSGMADTSFHVRMSVSGEMAAYVAPDPEMMAPGRANYYHGNSTISGVPAYNAYQYNEVNPYTDMRVYHGRYGPKFAVIFKPHSDPSDFFLQFTGQDSLRIDVAGILKLYIKGQWIKLDPAIAYQIQNGEVVPILWEPEYITNQGQNTIHFSFGEYDPALPLVLRITSPPPPMPPFTPADPRNLGWSTYMGGDQGDEFMATGVDNNGDAYFCGYSNDINFPTNTGFQVFASNVASLQGNHDAVVAKFRHTDKRVLWTTYLGGNEGTIDFHDVGIDQATDLAVYRGSNSALEYVFVTGSTGCNDFPTPNESLTPFATAVNDPWGNTTSTMTHAAFITAFNMTNGLLHWGNTLGSGADGFWTADGMGVDVKPNGKVVWAGRLSQVFGGSSFDFNPVVPAGAFSQAAGGGFFVEFAPNYQYEWKIPIGSQCGDCGAYDVKFYDGPNYVFAALTGTAAGSEIPETFSLPVYAPPGFTDFYQGTPGGGNTDAYYAVLNLTLNQNEFCTFWGGSGDESGYAISTVGPRILMGGRTNSTDLDSDHLTGIEGIHDDSPGGDYDGFLLDFATTQLQWGSLYGGAQYDAILDITDVDDVVYLIGETGSPSGILFNDVPELYRQDDLGNGQGATASDGFLLSIDPQTKEALWSSYYGGYWTDRGWGVAVTPAEVYICGGSRSEQASFPLLEWNTNAPEDWFDGDLTNNVGGASGWYAFNFQYFSVDIGAGTTHDGFIASFTSPMIVGISKPSSSSGLSTPLIDPAGIWEVTATANSTLSVVDAAGRVVVNTGISGSKAHVDLRACATGIYQVILRSAVGKISTTRLLKP